MRIFNGVLCAFMALFAVVQVNDPDGLLWAVIYGICAIWCGVAAFRPSVLGSAPILTALGVTFAAAIGGMIWYWPTTPQWWMQDVWWETETAREGMGMMIIVVCLLAAGLTALRNRPA